MTAKAECNRVIWRFSDGRAGHDAQSRGLLNALCRYHDCDCHEVSVPFSAGTYPLALLGRLTPVADLPDPDLLLGAGHGTHLPMLVSKYIRGGFSVVLMKPSLPINCFDLCVVPEHDRVKSTARVLTTRGPLNDIPAGTGAAGSRGLVLLGGPSRHFHWDENTLLEQVREIIGRDPRPWQIADSPRTPASLRRRLEALGDERVVYRPFGAYAVRDLLAGSSCVWVSEDSMSMIYEALSSGAAVGVLPLEARKGSRLAEAVKALSEENMLGFYDQWLASGALAPPPRPLQESTRVAAKISALLGWQNC